MVENDRPKSGGRSGEKANGRDTAALATLRKADPVIAALIDANPDHDPGAWLERLPRMDAFGVLTFQVIGQQLSVAATRTMLGRLTDRFGGHLPTPGRLLAADPEDVRAAGLASRLPRQLVHGDFWDNNVLFLHGRPVLLADFDFMGERARIDDLALTLHCTRSDLSAEDGPAQDRARLRRLIASYDAGLDQPLSADERAALPVAMARQPLSSIGGWVARLDDEAATRRHAASVTPELQTALQIMTELRRWREVFA